MNARVEIDNISIVWIIIALFNRISSCFSFNLPKFVLLLLTFFIIIFYVHFDSDLKTAETTTTAIIIIIIIIIILSNSYNKIHLKADPTFFEVMFED